MKRKARIELLVGVLFIYASALLINYLVKSNPNLHFAKDGGITNVAVFHCISSYLLFLIIHRSAITLIGLGFFVGLASCLLVFVLTNAIKFNIPDWFNYVLLLQIIASTFVFIVGIIYKVLITTTGVPETDNQRINF
jgi:hypothetical protein